MEGGLVIRHACMADIPAIIALCKEARDTSATLAGIDGCRETLTANLQAMCLSPHHIILVKDVEGEAVGVLIGIVSSSWWHRGFDATEVCFYLQPGHRGGGMKMLDSFLDWAWGFPQTQQVFLSISYGGDAGRRTERLYDRRFTRVGSSYSILRGEL